MGQKISIYVFLVVIISITLLIIFSSNKNENKTIPSYKIEEIEIKPKDQLCDNDSDCKTIETTCSGCSCPLGVINKFNIEKYDNQLDDICKNYKGGIKDCDLCTARFPKCFNNTCILTENGIYATDKLTLYTYEKENYNVIQYAIIAAINISSGKIIAEETSDKNGKVNFILSEGYYRFQPSPLKENRFSGHLDFFLPFEENKPNTLLLTRVYPNFSAYIDTCDEMKETISEILDNSNYCEQNLDCMNTYVYHGLKGGYDVGFGCFGGINRNYIPNVIQQKISEFANMCPGKIRDFCPLHPYPLRCTSSRLCVNIPMDFASAMRIANYKAQILGYDIKRMESSFDLNGTICTELPQQKIEIFCLYPENFWIIRYKPKISQPGGDLVVVIDIYTGEFEKVIPGQ